MRPTRQTNAPIVQPLAAVSRLESRRLPELAGNKAANLHFLVSHGFTVPNTYTCAGEAYRRYRRDDVSLVAQLRSELDAILEPGRAYAVRSSANLEDRFASSFAGQFKSVLEVCGRDNVLQAMWSIWASASAPALQGYLEKHQIDPEHLVMGIVLQEMVTPVISGVSFSKNPLTSLDEVIVEAVHGSGEGLMRAGNTPERWVSKWGAWIEQPASPTMPTALIQQVVNDTHAIARAYGKPVDLEWVYDGQALYWVQLREITSLKVSFFSNRIAREMLPGSIPPLIWSINIPLVNGAWVRLLTELIGKNDIDPLTLARHIYYRAYFNMGTFGEIFALLGMPRDSLELLMGIEVAGAERPRFKPTARTFRHLGRMLTFAVDKMTMSRRIERFLTSMHASFSVFDQPDLDGLDERALLERIDRLYPLAQENAYFNILGILLTSMHNQMFKSSLEKEGLSLNDVDKASGRFSTHHLDPNLALLDLHVLYERLPADDQAAVCAGALDAIGDENFIVAFDGFIKRFGHLSDSGNDFSRVPWRETPGLMLKAIAAFQSPPERATPSVEIDALRVSSLRRLMLHTLFQRAQRFAYYRESISGLYTYGYGLFRPYFMALAKHFVARGWLSAPNDIFLLYLEEIRAALAAFESSGVSPDGWGELVGRRRDEMETTRHLPVPETVFGDEAAPLELHPGEKLSGTPTSRGYYRGPVKVVLGISDFHKVNPGDVLVIPHSDVGMMPLFARASAVVAESGGLLSHSSIVAREYNIPAVVSVSGACRLADNTLVTVDGFKGEVLIHQPISSLEVAHD